LYSYCENCTLDRKIAAAPTDQMSRLQVEIQNLQAQLQTRPPVTKEFKLVAMVPKWYSTDMAVPLHEFFEILESTVRIVHWTHDDLVRIAAMRLTDVTRIDCFPFVDLL
jgi:hypothetical protein